MSGREDQGAWFNWHECLKPGEKILWQGRPREGAGWRCVLREDRLRLLLSLAVAVVVAAMIAGSASGSEAAGVGVGFAVLALCGVGLFVRREGRALAAMRYAVTERRCLAVDLTERVMLSVRHDKARPARRETPCGTVLDLGAAQQFAWMSRLGWIKRQDVDSDPVLRFRALDPETAPFDMTLRLARDAAAAKSGFGRLRGGRGSGEAPVPGMTDYVPPLAAPEGASSAALPSGRDRVSPQAQTGGAT